MLESYCSPRKYLFAHKDGAHDITLSRKVYLWDVQWRLDEFPDKLPDNIKTWIFESHFHTYLTADNGSVSMINDLTKFESPFDAYLSDENGLLSMLNASYFDYESIKSASSKREEARFLLVPYAGMLKKV